MSSKQGWVQLPLEPAAPWLLLPVFARCLGSDLFRVWQDRTVAGITMDNVEDVVVRMLAPDMRERKALRSAVRSIIEAGLIVAVEGGVRLLYGAGTYTDHRRMVDASPTNGRPMVDERYTDGAQMGGAKDAESLDVDLQIDREKERERRAGARGASGAHGFEVSEAHRKAWSDANAGTAPVLTGQPFTAAVEFARQVAKTHQKTLHEAAYAIAAHVLKQNKTPRDIPFDLARMDPYAAAKPSAPTPPRHIVFPVGLP